VRARRDALTGEQQSALESARPEIRRLAQRLARSCPHLRLDELETMAEDLFIGRARRWDPAKGRLFDFARCEVTKDMLRAAYGKRDPALGKCLRAMDAQEDGIVAPDTAARWAETPEAKHERAVAMGLDQAIAGLYAYGAASATRSPEDEYAGIEWFAAMKRAAATVEPRAAELLGLLYEDDLTWEEASAKLDLDPRQAQRIEARVLARLRAIHGAREQRAP